MARRVLWGIIVDARGRDDREYQKLLEEVRPTGQP